MRHYELVTVISPMLNPEQTIAEWTKIKEFISSRNAEIVIEQNWGTRRLAYPIHKGNHNFLEGSYQLTHFSTEVPFNQELHTFLRLEEPVLRALIVATGPPTPPPPPVQPAEAAEAEPAEVAEAEPVAETEPAAVNESEAVAETDSTEEAKPE